MKQKLIAVLAIALGLGVSTAFADFTDVSNRVNTYNSLNSGKGALFTPGVSSGQYTLVNSDSYYQGETRVNLTGTLPNLDAYSTKTSGTNYFQTFCIQTQEYVSVGSNYKSQLSLSGSQGNASTTSAGLGAKALTQGTALLYESFARGTLLNYDYTYGSGRASDASALQAAIWKLQGQTLGTSITALTSSDWISNKYLAYLLTLNSSTSYWLSTYDPSVDNDGYYVLVMQNTDLSNGNAQDFLYLAKGGSSGVPEPATICLWLFGVGGAAMFYKKRKKENLG